MPSFRTSFDYPLLMTVALVLLLEIVLYAISWITGARVAPNYLPSLFAAKITFITLITATITFLHRLFWDEVRSLPTAASAGGSPGDPAAAKRLAEVVTQFRFYYLLLFSAILTTFVAIIADSEIAVGTTSDLWHVLSLSSAESGLCLLVVFLAYFVGKTLRQMGTMLHNTTDS